MEITEVGGGRGGANLRSSHHRAGGALKPLSDRVCGAAATVAQTDHESHSTTGIYSEQKPSKVTKTIDDNSALSTRRVIHS
jgi:hypothetical protein